MSSLSLVATCGRGLEPLLDRELRQLGLGERRRGRGAVSFRGSWEDAWRCNWWLRTANRVLVELGSWAAPDDDRLAEGARRLLVEGRGARADRPLRDLLLPDRTFALHAAVSRSRIRDLRWAALRVKDGLVDGQRELFQRRSSIDRRAPDLPLRLRIDRDRATLLLDSSGEPLDRRGYRLEAGPAPLREQLAAACVLATDWDGCGPVVDPMCGAGTLLVEAAWISLGWPPGRLRAGWAFERFPGFDRRRFETTRGEDPSPFDSPLMLFGNDRSRGVLDAAHRNLVRAGLGDRSQLRHDDAALLSPPQGAPGLLLVNPPYGGRIEDDGATQTVLRELLTRFGGWKAVVLAGDPQRGRGLGLRPRRRIPVRNGPLEAEILTFELPVGGHPPGTHKIS